MSAALPSRTLPDRRSNASREALLHRVSAEFIEMPCLRLTRGQAQRLFSLRPDVCERVLATLVRRGTLTCGGDGRYRLNESHSYTPGSRLYQKTAVFPPKAS